MNSLGVLLITYGVLVFKAATFAGFVALFAITPWGRRLRARLFQPKPDHTLQQDMLEELHRLRGEMTEVQERLDFAERLLSSPDRDKSNPDPTPRSPEIRPRGDSPS